MRKRLTNATHTSKYGTNPHCSIRINNLPSNCRLTQAEKGRYPRVLWVHWIDQFGIPSRKQPIDYHGMGPFLCSARQASSRPLNCKSNWRNSLAPEASYASIAVGSVGAINFGRGPVYGGCNNSAGGVMSTGTET